MRRGARTAKTVEEQEARQAHILHAKCAERAAGPEQSRKWPTEENSGALRPIVAETAIFVDTRMALSPSAESMTHIRRDTQDQRAMAAGLAAWLQMVTHPLAGKVEQVSTTEGHVIGRLSYNMPTESGAEMRSKVHIDVIALPVNANEKLSADNCAGIVLRAMACDWDYSFSDALKWTVVGNSRLASHHATRSNIGPTGTARQTTKKLYEKLGSSRLLESFPETLLHDVLTRPGHYKSAMDEWADIERAKLVEDQARKMRAAALRKKQAAQKRERKRAADAAARAGGGGGGGGGGDDGGDDGGGDDESAADMEADDDEVDDEAHAELTDAELRAITDDARRAVRNDPGLHINILMSTLHMDGDNNAQRRQCAEAMMGSSIHVHNADILRFDVTDPVTLSEQLDSLPYSVNTLQRWVSWVGMSFCADDAAFRDALDAAKRLDATGFMHTNLRTEAVAPERMFTLAGALRQAEQAGAAPELCSPHLYYGVRENTGEYGIQYDPEVVFDTVTFAPTGRVPTWNRTEAEIAALATAAPQTEVNMAPFFARIAAPECTRHLPTKDAGFETFRHFLLWFMEDTILEEIEECRKKALASSATSKHMLRSLNHSMALFSGLKSADTSSLFVDGFHKASAEETERINAVNSIGLGMGRTLSDAADRARRACQIEYLKRLEERRNVPSVLVYNVEYTESDIGVNNHYQSNFTIAAEKLRPAYQTMEELYRLDYAAYESLMPRFRDYCARVMSRICVTGSFNNGAAMNAICKYARTNWSDPTRICGSGAFQRVKPISSALSHFGNRMAGDIIALSAVLDVSFCHQVMWSMLTCTRGIAFHNGIVKSHQINHSQAGDGKSRMVDQVCQLSVPQTYIENMVTSTMAHVDAMASDDTLIVMDEAPKLFQEPNKMGDKDEHTQNNVFRGIMSAGKISVARSVKGQWTQNYTADHKVTIIMNANRMDAPFGFEFSLLTRLSIVRPADNTQQGSNIYDIHNLRPKSNNMRRPVIERLWRSTQCLQAMMAKMITGYALPDPDTTVVSCLMPAMARRIDAFYPMFSAHMRGSKRIANTVVGYAMFNAQGLVFNSNLSPFSPEHCGGISNPGFDVKQLLRCAPFLFGTTEMLVASMIQVFEQTVPTELHMMMFALATKKGFARSEFAHLFAFGGRDFAASATANPADFTEDGIGGGRGSKVPPTSSNFVSMLTFANTLQRLGHVELNKRQERAIKRQPVYDDARDLEGYKNSEGQLVTPRMMEAAEFERKLMEWHAAIPAQTQRDILESTGRSGSEVQRFKRGPMTPTEYDRTLDEMPPFWTTYEEMMDAMEERNNRVNKGTRRMSFVPREGTSGGFDPNYIRFTFENRGDAHTTITQAMGAYNVSKVNWEYVCNHFVRNRNGMLVRLPQLNSISDSLATDLSWDVDKQGKIRTKMVPMVVYGKGGKYLDINVPWLMLGGWHNHLMTMISTLDDHHVPKSGHTLVLPLPNPRAPWLMQSVKLKHRAGHFIQVPNPAYVREGSDTAVLSALPAPTADESLFQMLEEKALGTEVETADGSGTEKCIVLGDGSAAGGVGFRAASALLTTVSHSVESEGIASATDAELRAQRRVVRHEQLCKRLRAEHEHLVSSGAEPGPLRLPAAPVNLMGKDVNLESEPDKFMAPTRSTLVFDQMSVDNTLHKVFMYRTGQPGREVKWSQVEAALSDDNRAVHEHLAKMYKNAENEAVRHVLESNSASSDVTLDSEMHKIADTDYDSGDDEYGNNTNENDLIDGDGDDDALLNRFHSVDSDQSGDGGSVARRRKKSEQRSYRDELISVTRLLGKYLEQDETALSEYPGRYLPDVMPEWMRRNKADAKLHAGSSLDQARIISSLPLPPEITPELRSAYDDAAVGGWGRSDLALPWKDNSSNKLLPAPDDDADDMSNGAIIAAVAKLLPRGPLPYNPQDDGSDDDASSTGDSMDVSSSSLRVQNGDGADETLF